jgi:NADH:ubiquinone oxidoreductase subunit 5 (subunit L)/multisubunit Na+/H+ antiporter MnhA subunit
MSEQGIVQLTAVEWVAITAVLGILCLIIGYFVSNWKKSIETSIKNLLTKADKNRFYFEEKVDELIVDRTKCKLNVAQNFVRTKDCNDTVKRLEQNQTLISQKMEELKDTMAEHHSQVMYQLGVKNGRLQSRDNT